MLMPDIAILKFGYDLCKVFGQCILNLLCDCIYKIKIKDSKEVVKEICIEWQLTWTRHISFNITVNFNLRLRKI